MSVRRVLLSGEGRHQPINLLNLSIHDQSRLVMTSPDPTLGSPLCHQTFTCPLCHKNMDSNILPGPFYIYIYNYIYVYRVGKGD